MIRPAILALACLLAGGCARLLQTLIAPQETVASTAADLADRATAGSSQEIEGLRSEVGRLRALRDGNASELARIDQELHGRQSAARSSGGAEQRNPARRRPWDLRTTPARAVAADDLVLAPRPLARARGQPQRSTPLPDGTPQAQAPALFGQWQIRRSLDAEADPEAQAGW